MRTHLPAGHPTAILCAAAVLAILVNQGCGGAGGLTRTTVAPTSGTIPTSVAITMAISPSSADVFPGGSIVFAASVTGTTNTAVNWSVQETNGGTITSAGIYTAPAQLSTNPSTFHVIATSAADPSRNAKAALVVRVPQSVTGAVNPLSANVLINGTMGFQAVGFDIGAVGWAWHWSVKEGSAGGTMIANANDPSRAAYTAPARPGTFHVVLNGETIATDPYGNPWLEIDASATVTVLPEANAGTFVSTGSMNAARGGYTATLLRDGRVLVAGGDNSIVGGDSNPPSTAEVYDPGTGVFTPTGNLTASRYNQVAARLRDGRVLLAGGYVCIGTITRCMPSELSSAEIYDPAGGTFTATANMLAAHPCPNALPLPNGKVLILGGGPAPLTAEIYDPETQAFSPANASNSHELFLCPAAILLANGKVLIAPDAAYYDDPGPSQLEIFDPATGEYTTTAPIFRPGGTDVGISCCTTLTLLNTGHVLVAGSEDTVCTPQGCEISAFDAASWLFDPSAGSAQPTSSMHVGRIGFTHTLLQDGTVLLTGGYSAAVEASAELYDPQSGTFSSVSNMSSARYNHTATLLNDGRVLIAGGGQGTSAELYYPARTPPPSAGIARH